jgi:hypothetical protein
LTAEFAEKSGEGRREMQFQSFSLSSAFFASWRIKGFFERRVDRAAILDRGLLWNAIDEK